MTAPAPTPEDEAKAAVSEQYAMVIAQQDEYGWEPKAVDVGDYLVIFVRITKPGGRTFVIRLCCDDYPEIAPELAFIEPAAFESPTLDAQPTAECYPAGNFMVAAGQLGVLPVPCVKGHRDYYRDGWHGGWSNPPTHDHSLYQLVMNVRNAILDHWTWTAAPAEASVDGARGAIPFDHRAGVGRGGEGAALVRPT
ncbi:MAG TPA: hypothetical protein VMO88_13945 [Acidimicrobiales bacterium]|nr:hypothetical protein [Acidimicrobiales bacterium]